MQQQQHSASLQQNMLGLQHMQSLMHHHQSIGSYAAQGLTPQSMMQPQTPVSFF